MFPEGKTAATETVRAKIHRRCAENETMTHYLESKVDQLQWLGELCPLEAQKEASLREKELINSFKDGIRLTNNSGCAVTQVFRTLAERDHDAEKAPITVSELRDLVKRVEHVAGQVSVKRPASLQSRFRATASDGQAEGYQSTDERQAAFSRVEKGSELKKRGGSQVRSSILAHERNQLPNNEKETVITRSERSAITERLYARDDEDQDGTHGAGDHENGGARESDSSDQEVQQPKPIRRKRTRAMVGDIDGSAGKPAAAQKPRKRVKKVQSSENDEGDSDDTPITQSKLRQMFREFSKPTAAAEDGHGKGGYNAGGKGGYPAGGKGGYHNGGKGGYSTGGKGGYGKGGYGKGMSNVNQTPLGRSSFCRHCGERLHGDHDCDNMKKRVFWCYGCAGVIANVSSEWEYVLHLHECPKIFCRRCDTAEHSYLTCPTYQCHECNKMGHVKILHQWEQGAGPDFMKLLGKAAFKATSKNGVHPDRRGRVRFAKHDSYCDGNLEGSSETQPSLLPVLRVLPRNNARVAMWEELPLAYKALTVEPTLPYASEITQAAVEQPLPIWIKPKETYPLALRALREDAVAQDAVTQDAIVGDASKPSYATVRVPAEDEFCTGGLLGSGDEQEPPTLTPTSTSEGTNSSSQWPGVAFSYDCDVVRSSSSSSSSSGATIASDPDEVEPTSSRAAKRHCVGSPQFHCANLFLAGHFASPLIIQCLWRSNIDALQLVSRGFQQFVLHWLGGVLRDTERLRERQLTEAGCPGLNLAFVPLVALERNAPTDQKCLCYVCEFNTPKHCLKHHGEQIPAWSNEPRRFECFVQQRRSYAPRTTREAVYAELWCLGLRGGAVNVLDYNAGSRHYVNDFWALRQYMWTHVCAANVSRILRQGANLKIKTRWISHEESNTTRRWDVLVQSADQTLSAIQGKMAASNHFKVRANECRRVIERGGPLQCIPVYVLKAYHSYLAAAVQKEQALTPLIGRDNDPDCRKMVQHSFKGPAHVRTQASMCSERVVTTVKREDASTLEGYGPLRRHLMSGFDEARPPRQRKYDARRITNLSRVDDFIQAAPQNAYTMTAGQAGLLEMRRLDKLHVRFTSQPVQTEFCDMWLVGSGDEEEADDAEDVVDDAEDVVSVVWFVYLTRGKEQALVWVLNEEFVLQTSRIGNVMAARVHEKSTNVPLFTLRQAGGIIRDSPPSADNERVCQVCRTHRTAEKETLCLLCQYGFIVGKVQYKERDAGQYTMRDAELHNPTGYMVEVQNRVDLREWVRFDIDTIMPMFSHGDEVSKAYGDTLVQLWKEGCRDLDSKTQWQQRRGIALLTEVMSKPDELEKNYRAPNDGLLNGASRCWANTLLQILSVSAKLREKLQASKSLRTMNLLKILELLQSNEGPLSRVERSKQTNAAAEAFYNSMGDIFANKRHNCLHEGYCKLLSVRAVG